MSDTKKNITGVLGTIDKVVYALKTPGRKYKEAEAEYRTFYNETLLPTIREKEFWEKTRSGLETLVSSENGETSVDLVKTMYAGLNSDARDSYKSQLIQQLDVYMKNGLPMRNEKIDTLKLKNDLAPAQNRCGELIIHYEQEAERIKEEKGVSKVKMYTWKAAETGEKAAAVGIGLLLLARKIFR